MALDERQQPTNGQGSSMIITEYVRPPIPTTKWDWMAFIEGDEEGNYPTGRGPTETEALRDLSEQLARLVFELEDEKRGQVGRGVTVVGGV